MTLVSPSNDRIAFNEYVKDRDFDLLKAYKITTYDDGALEFEYKYSDLVNLTHALMYTLGINYDSRYEESDRKLSDFSEAEKAMYYPFALMLACLDGNAFRNPEVPENDLVWQYVPTAAKILKINSVDQGEVLFFLARAAMSA